MTDKLAAHTDKLDFFALETLVRSMLAVTIHQDRDKERLIRELFEVSVGNFRLGGADEETANEARDYMLQRGLEWIASSAAWQPGHR